MGSGGRLWKGCAEREGCVSFGEKRDLVWSLAHPVDSIQPRIDPALRLMASACSMLPGRSLADVHLE
jgi:hypothetical protein